MSIRVYGNAPAGEHHARYITNFNTKYPKGYRLIIAFGLCNQDGSEAVYGPDGEPLNAVIVCNATKGDNPKSVAHKVRKAMLMAEEYDPFTSAFKVPSFEELEQSLPDSSHRVLTIAVERRKAENGEVLSLVTCIRQPRDGQWFTVRQTYDGPPYSWLTKDGQRKKLSDKQLAELPPFEREVYEHWTISCSHPKWTDDAGRFVPLSEAEVAALESFHRPQYEVARVQAMLRQGPP